jgi:hypothetical protein
MIDKISSILVSLAVHHLRNLLIKRIQQKFGFSCIPQNNYLRYHIPANTDLYYKLERKIQNITQRRIIITPIKFPFIANEFSGKRVLVSAGTAGMGKAIPL